MKNYSLLLFGACALFPGCNGATPSPEEVAVNSVYAFNMGVVDNSVSPAEVAAKLNSANLAGCPQDFVSAYKKYAEAWAGLEALAKKMYSADIAKAEVSLRKFIENYGANPTAAAVALKRQWPQFAAEIGARCAALESAFSALKSAGVKYNAAYSPRAWYSM